MQRREREEITNSLAQNKKKMSNWILPKSFELKHDIDWELERKRLPNEYIVALDRTLLDKNSYPREEHDKIGHRSDKAYERTKKNARQMLPLMKGRPVQVAHGVDLKLNDQGLLSANVGTSVIGTVTEGWIDKENDNELFCKIKLNVEDASGLFWNYAISHKPEIISGASLYVAGYYDYDIPLEVSLLDKGVKEGTGITHVITRDGRTIKFKLYKVEDEEIIELDPTTTNTEIIQEHPEMATTGTVTRPRDASTGQFVPAGQAQAQQQQQQQYSTPTNTPGSFKHPMNPKLITNPTESHNKEYNLNQNFNGVLHTNFLGGPMQGIAISEQQRYLDEALQEQKTSDLSKSFMQTHAVQQQQFNSQSQNPAMIPNPIQESLFQQQQQQAQAQAQAQAAAAQSAAPMEAESTSTTSTADETDDSLKEWREKATTEEISKVSESASEKIKNGKITQLNKREALIAGEMAIENEERMKNYEKEKKDLKDESDKTVKNLMSGIMSGLISLDPKREDEFKAIESLGNACTAEQAVQALPAVNYCLAAAGSRFAEEKQSQKRVKLNQPSYAEKRLQELRQKHTWNTIPNHPSRTIVQSSPSAPAPAPAAAVDMESNYSYNGAYVPTSTPRQQQQQQQQQYQAYNQHVPMQIKQEAVMAPAGNMYNQTLRAMTIDPKVRRWECDHLGLKSTELRLPFDLQVRSNSGSSNGVLAPAGNQFQSGGKRVHDSNDGYQEEEEDVYYPPDCNTRVDKEWLHNKLYPIPEYTKMSYVEHGHKQGFTDTMDLKLVQPTHYEALMRRANAGAVKNEATNSFQQQRIRYNNNKHAKDRFMTGANSLI